MLRPYGGIEICVLLLYIIIIIITGQVAVLCGWEGNRRRGVTLAICHRRWYIYL